MAESRLGIDCAEFCRHTSLQFCTQVNCQNCPTKYLSKCIYFVLCLFLISNEFIEKLVIERADDLSPIIKMKLLNINAATQLLQPAYNGSKLSAKSSIFSVPIVHNKNKLILVNGLLDALKSLFSSDILLRTNTDTSMGFVIGKINFKYICVLFKRQQFYFVTVVLI